MTGSNEGQNQCVAVISSLDADVVRSQYDAVLAALSYDWSVRVVFFPAAACCHLDTGNPAARAWKALPLYGVREMWLLSEKAPKPDQFVVPLGNIMPVRVRQWLRQARWII